MKDIRNCKECGRIFQYDGISKLCYKCRRQDDEDFRVVREYVYENPKSTIQAVSEETEVSEDKILRYLREGRLEIVGENPGLLLDCESCGAAIRTGRFCNDCATSMERGLKKGFNTERQSSIREDKKSGNRMHYTDLKKKK